MSGGSSEDFAAKVGVTRRVRGAEEERLEDWVALEEPLEIRVNRRPFAVVMRTPGHDLELAAGHLLSEAVIQSREQIEYLGPCRAFAGPSADAAGQVVEVDVVGVSEKQLRSKARTTAVGASCGTCGKTSIEAIHQNFPPLRSNVVALSLEILSTLSETLSSQQKVFQYTGELHAMAVFRADGSLIKSREDVGRHNALDKVLGYALMNGLLPLENCVLFVSGRVSFEIMQKALAGRIATVCGISAPTSLAVEFAKASGQTLLGFVRDGRANVYAGRLG